jgi:hypothetical protein
MPRQQGNIRVGTITINKGKRVYPLIDKKKYEMIEVMTCGDKKWWELSIYAGVNGKKQILENIYYKNYAAYVRAQQKYETLFDMIRNGKNVSICEVDGPHQESLQYYMNKYGVSKSFIRNNQMDATRKSLDIMLNDTKHPFGHGYCLAACLLEDLNK